MIDIKKNERNKQVGVCLCVEWDNLDITFMDVV